ncbi:MAG: hypothetical protein ACI4ES_14090 [Roseburia sp.]
MIIQSDSIRMNSQRSYEEKTSASSTLSTWNVVNGSSASVTTSYESVYREEEKNGQHSSTKREDAHKNNSEDLLNRFQMSQSIHGLEMKEQLKSLDELRRQSIDYLLYLLFGKKGKAPDMSLTKSSDSSTINNFGEGGEYVSSFYYSEQETTCFDAKGTVVTADGKSYSIQISLEMSRSFTESTSSMISYGTPQLCDPLVINLSGTAAHISDQKFFFDLNADGRSEEISALAKGSGYLAYDKNENGRIDNGSELFGTTNGNGFKDFAAYDKDQNGWIDEADEIFSKLLIWTKDSTGKDVLCGLGEAGVGAIYLGNQDTNYSIKNQITNETEAVIRKTGLFLYENGGTGTLQQLDLAL